MRGMATMPRRGGARVFEGAINTRARSGSVGRCRALSWTRRGVGAHGGSAEGWASDRSRRLRRNDLAAPPPVSISIEYAVAGSPQDERLCREQTRAVLDLLADIIKRRKEAA